MPIAQNVKDHVRLQVLADLEAYFKEAEEHEDDSTLDNPDVVKRTADFYIYQYEGKTGPTQYPEPDADSTYPG